MDPPWSDGVYTGDVPPDFEEVRIREGRKERISQYWDLLVADQEPQVNRQALLYLMQDLKDEGNLLFKELQYDVAWMHYRNALFIARILETRFYHEVDKEFISTLFSNRAFCCLKKEMYNEAIQDCESAIQIHSSNVKAYYRQVLALKAQNRLQEALNVAQKGYAIKQGVFKDLVEEIRDIIAEEKRKTQVSAKNAKTINKDAPDSEWLSGTNVGVTKKNESKPKLQGKKGKGKTIPQQQPQQQNINSNSKVTKASQKNGDVYSSDGDPEDEREVDSDSEEGGLSEDEKFASTFLNVRKNKLQSPGREFHTKISPSNMPNLDITTSPKQMGLDSFSPPAGKITQKSILSQVSSASSFTGYSTQKQKVPPQATQRHNIHPAQSSITQPVITEELKQLVLPLENFDFQLACQTCFVKTGEGIRGYKYTKTANHNCGKDVLLVKLNINRPGINWMKIRPRPDTKMSLFGGFKLCAHFVQCHPCKVGEERCTFAHNNAEVELWTMDREGSFDIKMFISQLKYYDADNSEKLRALQHGRSSTATEKSGFPVKPQKLEEAPITSFPLQPQTTPALPKNQQVMPKVHQEQPQRTAQQNVPMNPTINRPHMNPPQHVPHYGYPQGSNYGYSQPQGPLFGFHQRPPHGMPPPGMRFPPPHTIRGRFHPPGHHMDPNFQAPTSQAQIRPNLISRPVPKPVAEQYQETHHQEAPVMKQDFPLKETHDYKLACKECFKSGNMLGVYHYTPTLKHKCAESMLIVKARQAFAPWNQVRERKNHRVFTGRYILCNSVFHGNPALCRFGEETCSFAHNEEEQKLWTLEKDEKFDITEFIVQCREKQTEKGYGITEIFSRHSGYLSFICKACFYATPSVINREGAEGKCCGPAKHNWKDFRILTHFGTDGKITVINPRGFLHKSAFFKICKWLHFCRNRVNAECRFAHSLIERDIWMFERDTGLTQEQIVQESAKVHGAPEMKTVTTEITPSDTLFKAPTTVTKGTVSRPSPSSSEGPSINVDEQDDLCPFNIQELCQTCWKNGKKSTQDGDRDRCTKNHSNWARNRVYLLIPSNKELRPLPRKIPKGFAFIICKFVRERGKCGYTGGGQCQFAHGQEELEAWQWMCAHDFTDVEELYKTSKEAQKIRAASTKNKIVGGESVVSVTKNQAPMPMQMSKFSPHYCTYCGKQCNSEKQWEEHCASERHMFNVNSDKEHQWNYRQPPWGIPAQSYEICMKHVNGNKCAYSNVPDIYNLCQYAHSQEELDEWRERYEWRQMKREMARQEKVFSFMDELMEQYEEADSGIQVICEHQDDVSILCEQELNIYEEEKNATFFWTFEIRTKRTLNRVALLYNKDRLHFALLGPDHDQPTQIAPGDQFEDVDAKGRPIYRMHVQFTGTMFGSFSQWVIFDFGTMPVLVRKLSVEVGTTNTHDKVKSLREKLQFDRWTSENRRIERFSDQLDDLERRLVNRYKSPGSSESVITQQGIVQELNRNNYQHKMRKLLELEEITRHQIISSYNLVGRLEFTNTIQEGTYVYAQPGELFAKVALSDYLSEDTDAGKLILTSVRKVLLAPRSSTGSVVYEAVIVSKENFDYDGRGKDYIYLCLSPGCITDLGLKHGGNLEVEIQFTMDRMWFCRMHFAIEQLRTTDLVFPDITKINPMHERQVFKVSSQILNPDQIQAVQHIVTERFGYTPPFVIYGPFGTGKTETIAQSVMVLLKERPSSKILICAQSNSAADLYITKHLDPFLRKSNTVAKLRRVYFKDRRVNTVPQEVKKYCLISSDNTFGNPTQPDIMNHNVVIITLSTSLLLTNLGLQGYFTHIFLDEAAQALETETIMPLSLATEKTCVVLAGDHHQISPKVYSEEARNQKLDMSLLERMFEYYESFSDKIDQTSPLNILLSINYRTKMEILRFISAIFYGGPDKLVSRANLPSVLGITPLMFYAVQGVEIQDPESISFYNTSEVQEIVERVQELYNQWPTQWGERKAKDIGVVTPYYDQVLLIRKALRKKHSELGKVTVERVNNVQGKEFRALFISTVRTRSLINSPLSGLDQECEGDGGDFGFLSDPKLLNTALTRAQSFVAVVGDPVALCAIGDCLNVWRTYLKHCQNMNSINPRSLTLESIKHQVSSLLNSPARERMIQMANQRKQASKPPLVVPVEPASAPPPPLQLTQWTKKADATSTEDTTSLENEIVNDLFNAVIQQPTSDMFEENGKERELTQKDIMKRLALEVIKVKKLQEMEEQAKAQGRLLPSKDIMINETVKMEMVNLKEIDGNVVLTYMEGKSEDVEIPELSEIYNQSQLQALLLSNADKFKHCILHRDSEENIYAKVLDSNSPYSKITVNTSQRCHKAFHGDEVVVEIIPLEDDDFEDDNVIGVKVQGCVVGILHRHINPDHNLFVCMPDAEHPGLLIPINTGIPKIYNLLTQCHIQRTKKGNVSVYKVSDDGTIAFSQYVKVDPCMPCEKLFIMRYLTWDSKFYHPVGIVVGVIDTGVKNNNTTNVMYVEDNVKKNYRPETEMEVHSLYPPAYNLPASEYQNCMDFRAKWTFSINQENMADIPTALSIEEMNDGNYVIGIHVTDVAYHVIKDSNVDKEAQQRGFTIRPIKEDAIYMLPPKLSTEVLSLKPDVDRLTLSIFLTVSKTGDILQTVPKRCVINSKQNFSFEDVEQVLHDPNAASDYLKSCVIVLYHISCIWRRQRLGNASMYQDLGMTEKLSAEAYLMHQELMIQTNHHVGRLLLENFPDITPLYCQSPPNVSDLEIWKQNHAADAINSVGLTKPFLEGFKTCTCKVACTCIINYIRSRSIRIKESFDIYQAVWNTVCQASEMGDIAFMQNILTSVESHPQLAVALAKLNTIQSRSSYICSSEAIDKKHYGLNLAPFVNFTSPLNRYIDICAHRLITSLVSNSSAPYTQDEVIQICQDFTHKSVSNMEFSSAAHLINLSTAMKSKSVILNPIVQDVNEEQITLYFPSLPHISDIKRKIDIHLLNPSEKPLYDRVRQLVQVTWNEKIYDPAVQVLQQDNGNSVVELNPSRFIFKIPSFQWQKLLITVREENQEKLQQAVQAMKEQVKNPEQESALVSEVPIEKTVRGNLKLSTEYQCKISIGNIMKVQIASELHNGLITPAIQLLGIANNVDICLQHRNNPVDCFTSGSTCASRANYQDETSYQNAWLSVLDIEAASEAVFKGNSLTIQNVFLQWKQENLGASMVYTAIFELPVEFLKERCIKVPCDMSFDDLFEPSNVRLMESHFSDFICVRCHNLHMPTLQDMHPSIAVTTNNNELITWVAHCIILMAKKVKDRLQVKVRLHQCSVNPPPHILHPSTKFPCTIEWIQKSVIHRQIDFGVRSVNESSQLSRDIARGRSPVQTVDYRDIDLLRQLPVPGLPAPDSSQDEAIRIAMQLPFSLIGGPPGSGKTVTGVRLAYMFAQRNKTFLASGIKPQVLVCGPNDHCLDIIVDFLKKLGDKCPKILRIYSEEVVLKEFPMPDKGTVRKRSAITSSVKLGQEDIALHQAIRKEDSDLGSSITKMDMLFQLYPDDIKDPQIEEYKAIVNKAESMLLREAEILLTTCPNSAATKLIHNSNVHQVIIDESGSCSEPETMVPINLNRNIKQITLIGDHRQLDPNIQSNLAKEMGLDKSLFERNAEKIQNLAKHYRMHIGLASLPAKLIYNTEFDHGTASQGSAPRLKIWPGNGMSPSVFCHVSGKEDKEFTEDLMLSYCNQSEINLVISIASRLVIGHKVKEENIAILTAFEAQSLAISKKLILKGHGGIQVKTVAECQGLQWDYVILCTTRSLPKSRIEMRPSKLWIDNHLGAMSNQHVVNLAITRAVDGLIILGNQHLLRIDPLWKKILDLYEKENRLLDGQDFLKRMS